MKFERIIDLTHELHEGIPSWSGGCGFHQEIKLDYPDGLRVMQYKCHAGIGTHMDAPSHYIEGSWNISDIPLEQMIVPLCVLHLEDKSHPDFFVEKSDLEAFEQKHGKIPENSLVVASTGWVDHWDQPTNYRNSDVTGHMHFPGFAAECADYLIDRDVAGIGIDTLSPDGSDQENFPIHIAILEARKYILENLCNLKDLPPVGATAIALPIKVRDGTEAAARVIALI